MPEQVITNPILRGFNPDPSIVRAGDDYYIAASTFEWFPGVQIHHSRDLVHWRLLARPLTRLSQLNMIGDDDSGGIWAPCLSYDQGTFYLVYTDVKNPRGPFKDAHNYLVTAPRITGPWSEPTYLNSSGFDPSLFHDEDGRKWLVNMYWDPRAGRTSFGGIVLQEYDPHQGALKGPVTRIFAGTDLGTVEGPHLYKRDGTYYLMTAEGGTGYGHAVTMARSRSIHGPYEVDPANPILTSRGTDARLQRAGHASLVECPDGSSYLVHLCSRPFDEPRRSILGRETAIQRCRWTQDGWLRLSTGANAPADQVPAPDLPACEFAPEPEEVDFDEDTLPLAFQSLRVPVDPSWMSLSERPGWLRLYGRESTASRHRQSLLARRVESVHCEAATRLDFHPDSIQQTAGLIATYNASAHYYLCVTWHEDLGRCLKIMAKDYGKLTEPMGEGMALADPGPVLLRVVFAGKRLQFSYGYDGASWTDVGPALDATVLSDEYCKGFTGAFVGMCAQDLGGRRCAADFDWFRYRAADRPPS